ncbi:substrate-binding domain-containing protein [Actinocrispum wychmicini]|uniref:von Willebrand factor type A domain-containing protein n=1 Tax=Actinocrispum wychmicini TaxID=1213861 RepID=A0A4R2J748_9PSEU|nr:substrate-binding domain-containing protein [Actinocrispum wychmicini]TCO53422.1 von Willebrand factor type A domain-containing protein [Actinocrispum wychmicini]
MGRHRALERVRHGVAKWPILAIVLVALVALGWVGVTWVNSVQERRASAQSHTCPAGESVLQLAVSPSVATPVQDAAKRWNALDTVVYDHCGHVAVTALDTRAVFDGMTAGWDPVSGPTPQAWLPDSSFWVNRLSAVDNTLVTSAPESIATSPVVLAVPQEAEKPMNGGDSFLFGDLAALTSAPNGWARYGRPEWGRFTVAMPDPIDNTASGLAIQCAIAGASPLRAGPVTVDMLTLPAVQQNLAQLAASRPDRVPGTTLDALTALGSAGKVQNAPFSAVPVTEVDLYRRNLGLDGKPAPAKPLYEVAARGPSPAADFPFVTLTNDTTLFRIAQKFREFLKEPAQQEDFKRAGLRAAGDAEYPHDAPGILWGSATTSLVPADANTTQQISATWSNTADGGQVVTVLVDVSRSMLADAGNGKSRIDLVKQALNGLTDRMTTGSLGVWEFSRNLDGAVPYRRLVQTGPAAAQRTALHAGIDALAPASATYLYTSLDAVYRSALDGYVDGKHNRVVVIVDGPNDGGLTFAQIRDRLKPDDKRKLTVSFIAVGPDPDRAELAKLATATGGTVSVVGDATGLDAALGQVLSAQG